MGRPGPPQLAEGQAKSFMRLTVHADYTLRVLMYLALRARSGAGATIAEIASAYGISRAHLMKVVHELAQHGYVLTTRGRGGGARLARRPSEISIGAVVRMAEKDFSVVNCHERPQTSNCAIEPACALKYGMRRAMDAFLLELDRMTLADAIIAPNVAATLLHVDGQETRETGVPLSSIRRRRTARQV